MNLLSTIKTLRAIAREYGKRVELQFTTQGVKCNIVGSKFFLLFRSNGIVSLFSHYYDQEFLDYKGFDWEYDTTIFRLSYLMARNRYRWFRESSVEKINLYKDAIKIHSSIRRRCEKIIGDVK